MDPRLTALANELSEKGPRPVYLVDGEETLLADEAARMIESVALGQGLRDFNLDRLQLGEASADTVISAASTLPMMGDRRVVVVRCPKGIDKATSDALAAYADNPSPRGTLLLVCHGKVDGNLRLPRALKKAGAHLRFEPLKPKEVPAWVSAHAAGLGFRIRPDAAAALADAIGTDLYSLSSEIEKLVAFTGGSRPIERADVDACVTRTREEVIWDLSDAVGEGNLRKALATLSSLMEHAQSPIAVNALLARHVRQLLVVKTMASRGGSPDAIAAEAKIHPFVAKKLYAQCRRFTEEALRSHLELLFETDRDLKSSRLADGLIMERLVFALCRRA